MKKRVIEIQPYCLEICQQIRQIENFSFYFSPFFPVPTTNLSLPIKNNFQLVLQQQPKQLKQQDNNNNKLLVLNFLEMYSHCQKSLSLLQKKEILYIKWTLDTVEFNDTNTPILNDFRYAIFLNSALSLDNIESLLSFLPLDVHVSFFLSKTQKPSLSQHNIEEICQKYSLGFPPLFREYVIKESIEFLLNQNNQNNYKSKKINQSFQWDIHAMHLFFLWRIDHTNTTIHNYLLDIILLKRDFIIPIPFDFLS